MKKKELKAENKRLKKQLSFAINTHVKDVEYSELLQKQLAEDQELIKKHQVKHFRMGMHLSRLWNVFEQELEEFTEENNPRTNCSLSRDITK